MKSTKQLIGFLNDVWTNDKQKMQNVAVSTKLSASLITNNNFAKYISVANRLQQSARLQPIY